MLQSRLDDGFEVLRDTVALHEDFPVSQSNLIYYLHFDPSSNPESIAATYRDWAAQVIIKAPDSKF